MCVFVCIRGGRVRQNESERLKKGQRERRRSVEEVEKEEGVR